METQQPKVRTAQGALACVFYKLKKKKTWLKNSTITPEKCLLNVGHFSTSFQTKNHTGGVSLNSYSALWGCIKTEAVDTSTPVFFLSVRLKPVFKEAHYPSSLRLPQTEASKLSTAAASPGR